MQIFLSSINSKHADHYINAGFNVSADIDIKANFCGPLYEDSLDKCKEYCNKYNLTHLNFDILDKTKLIDMCNSLNIPTLPMVLFDSPSKLNQFSNVPFILKPSIGFGSTSNDNIGYNIYNTIEDCLSDISKITDFFTIPKYYIQQSVVRNDENALLLLVQGFINGNQEIVFSEIIENYQVNGHPIETNDVDLTADEITTLKLYTTNLIKKANIKNTPFILQFIRKVNEPFYPIDFQYRMGYKHLHSMISYNQNYCNDLLKFTYDIIPSVLPIGASYLKKISVNVYGKNLNVICDQMKVNLVGTNIHPSHLPNTNITPVPEGLVYTPTTNNKFDLLFSAASDTRANAKKIIYDFEQQVILL